MENVPEIKFKVKVYDYPKDQKPPRVKKEVTKSLKGVVSAKKISKLKKQAIYCPVLDKERNFLECFSCKSHIRRVMGEVDCSGEAAELQV